MITKALIIPAAGDGMRMQREKPKPFIQLGGKTILGHTLSRFSKLEGLRQIVVAASASQVSEVENILQQNIGNGIQWRCVEGGTERQHSIHNALQVVGNVDLVIVHDAVRPFIESTMINKCCDTAEETGAAITGIPVKDTIKKIDDDGFVQETPDRKMLWQVQTPQVFKTTILKEAYKKAIVENYLGTDDASLVERLGRPVKVIEGSISNIKITYPQDLDWARLQLENETHQQ